MPEVFKPHYFKDPGGPLPPGFWIGITIVLALLYYFHGCSKGGVLI